MRQSLVEFCAVNVEDILYSDRRRRGWKKESTATKYNGSPCIRTGGHSNEMFALFHYSRDVPIMLIVQKCCSVSDNFFPRVGSSGVNPSLDDNLFFPDPTDPFSCLHFCHTYFKEQKSDLPCSFMHSSHVGVWSRRSLPPYDMSRSRNEHLQYARRGHCR